MQNFVDNVVWLTRNTNVQFTDLLQWFWFDYQRYYSVLEEQLKKEAIESKKQKQQMPNLNNMHNQMMQYLSKHSKFK